MSFAGKVVVVTGANSGIGAAIAVLFAKEGAELALTGRNLEKVNKVAEKCDSFGKKALIVKADLNKEDETGAIIPKVVERFGRIDVLVNNAGVYVDGTILDGNMMKTYKDVMTVNLEAPLLLTTQAAPYLVKTKGNIINISSITFFDNLTYGMSKAALDFFTKGAAFELGASGVRVNSINPGAVATDVLLENESLATVVEAAKKGSSLGKIIEPEEIAELALFLASEKAKSITGENYYLDNGFRLKSASIM